MRSKTRSELRSFISTSAMWYGTSWFVLSSTPISDIVPRTIRLQPKIDMFDSLKRGRLIRRGLASRKMRRRRSRNELLRSLEASPLIKTLIFAGFIAGLAFLIFSGQQPEPTKNFIIALLFFATAIVQLWINRPGTFSQNSRVFLVFGTIFIQLAATKVILVVSSEQVFKFLTPEMGWLLAPYAFAPLVLSVLLGRNHGLYAAVFVSLWSSGLFSRIDP